VNSGDLVKATEVWHGLTLNPELPGLVIEADIPSMDGRLVRFLGADGQVHMWPQRWLRVWMSCSPGKEETNECR